MKRKVTGVVEDSEGNVIRTSSNGSSFVVLECAAAIDNNVLLPSARKAFFGEEELLNKVKPGMELYVD